MTSYLIHRFLTNLFLFFSFRFEIEFKQFYDLFSCTHLKKKMLYLFYYNRLFLFPSNKTKLKLLFIELESRKLNEKQIHIIIIEFQMETQTKPQIQN